MKIIKYTIFSILIFITNISLGRIASLNEANINYEFYNKIINVKKDGSYTVEIEHQYTLLNNVARDYYGSIFINYLPFISNVEILEARTISEDKYYDVPKENIEDKKISSNAMSFDDTSEVAVRYPKAEVGSKIYIKYRINCHKPQFKNQYFENLFFGYNDLFSRATVKVISEIDLDFSVNDPTGALTVYNNKIDKIHTILVNQHKPIFFSVIDEYSINNPNLITYISFSSYKNFQELAKEYLDNFEKVKNQKLPDFYSEIFEHLRKNKLESDHDVINYITSTINSKIRYLGDWRSNDGYLYPQDLKKVIELGYGDCKDFSTATAAILTNLGYESYVALVNRTLFPNFLHKVLINPGLFNHAIVYVKTKSGKIFWIDPTNSVSMAEYIFPDIEDRISLILDPKNPRIENIPAIKPDDNKQISYQVISIADKTTNTRGNTYLYGLSSLLFTQMTKDLPDNIINLEFTRMFVTMSEPLKIFLKLPENFSHKILNDYKFVYNIVTKTNLIKTNFGNGITVSSNLRNSFPNITDEWTGIAITGGVYKKEFEYLIENKTAKNLENLNINIKSDWINIERNITQEKNGIKVNIKFENLKNFIRPEEYKSKEFKEFYSKFDNFFDTALILD